MFTLRPTSRHAPPTESRGRVDADLYACDARVSSDARDIEYS